MLNGSVLRPQASAFSCGALSNDECMIYLSFYASLLQGYPFPHLTSPANQCKQDSEETKSLWLINSIPCFLFKLAKLRHYMYSGLMLNCCKPIQLMCSHNYLTPAEPSSSAIFGPSLAVQNAEPFQK